MAAEVKDFVLASGSPQRKRLLEQIGFIPKLIAAADIDESNKIGETPTAYVKRMALEKAQKVAFIHKNEIVLGGDTIVVVGTKILHKAKDAKDQTKVMKMLSGKSHRVISAICMINRDGKVATRCVNSRIVMKKLSDEEIRNYVASQEWVGCCGYKIDGALEAFVKQIVGSYSGIIGLPLYETKNMLNGVGIK